MSSEKNVPVRLRDMTPDECESIGVLRGIGVFTMRGIFITWGVTVEAAKDFATRAGYNVLEQ